MPVLAAGEHIATIYGGQLMQGEPTRRAFEKLARQLVCLGLADQLGPLEEAWFQTPVVSEKQMQSIIYLLQTFASRISQHAAALILEPLVGESAEVTRVREFVRDRFSEDVTMHDAALHLKMSEPGLRALFRQTLGMTFIQYLTRYRVEASKPMLASPSHRIRVVARMAGFTSTSHYNRCFRQYAGMSPTDYRALLEGAVTQGRAHSDAP
jgi:AraC-like DNA-binding protein